MGGSCTFAARLAAILMPLILLLAPMAGSAQDPTGLGAGTIDEIRIEGSQRIEPSTVLSYMTVQPGDPFDAQEVSESLRALFDTGLFADIELERSANALVVRVVENPIINRIAFEGNQRIDDDELRREVQLRPRVVFTRTRVQADVDRILDVYRRQGRFAATVDPQIIELDQNRVDLVFEISEGPRTRVRSINFVGNREFSDRRLRGEIQTREARWYRFLTTDDVYDPDRVSFDEELLRRFYLSEGYADFRVVSSLAELTPDQQDFFVTFTVEEGERYRFGEIDLVTDIDRLNVDDFRDVVTTRSGDWYSAEEIETTIDELTEALEGQQFPFIDIRPRVERDEENLEINLTYELNEGQRVFVERINIRGNTRTTDEVVRREFRLVEGDPFSPSRLRQSERNIRDLDFFETVNVTTTEGSEPDQVVVDVEVTEQPTGEFSIGAGFSTADGPLGEVRLRERNLMGRGQDLTISAQVAAERQQFDLSFTEPYFLDRDLSAGFDVFSTRRDRQRESSFTSRETGFALRLGYPLGPNLRQTLNYRLEEVRIRDVDDNASRFIREQEGTRITSSVGHTLTYDRRDQRINPTEGYIVELSQDVAGIGGDARYVSNRLRGTTYFSVTDDLIFSLGAEAGYIFGINQDVSIADRFFLGGNSFRGFRPAGIGPRDLDSNDALGGNRYATASAELTFPLGLPEELGFAGHAFTDVGTLGHVDGIDEDIGDTESIRVSTGVGLSWQSPLGPLRFNYSIPVVKEDFDREQRFQFSFGTRF